jgi:hypothetical protein
VLEEGYCAVIAQGVDEARSTLAWYIGINDLEPASVLKTAQLCQLRSDDSLVKVSLPSKQITTLIARKRSVRN